MRDRPAQPHVPPSWPDVGLELGPRDELTAFLDRQRAAVHDKLAGLSEDDAWRRFVPSPITAAGIVKHLTCVEQYWFRHTLAGTTRMPALWGKGDPAAVFEKADGDTAGAVLAAYEAECDQSRAVAASMQLDERGAFGRSEGRPTLRWVLTHLIEETSRRVGQLDVIRELIDVSPRD